ncbi:hypothetical protein RirG_121660 [Rhizophagus irregularis DAOM 197198w]|uniref:CCHC-type domain-containing protein n=1 Tax=Rhizophagus irregularis (strain DAOM 197198w) TaxID=1432141 RepID=A0A015L2S5_RHIIW|nr:hypothetical protein RirG_121660 [Rhizophagus irregularis DAOM 197198w]
MIRLRNQNRFRQEPICYNCGRRGHITRNCSQGQRYERRVNVIEEYDEYDDQGYEGYDDKYERYEEPTELYYNDYDYELYPATRGTKERRHSRRTDPISGYKDDNEEDPQREMEEVRNRMNEDMVTPPLASTYEDSRNLGEPIGPKGMKWSGKRRMYYDPTEGLRKWREAGGKPTRSREYGPRMTDEVPPYDIVRDVKDTRANITFGQLVNENRKYYSQLRQGTYRPGAINKKD